MRLLSRDDRVSRGAIANLGRFNTEYIYILKLSKGRKRYLIFFSGFYFFLKIVSLCFETKQIEKDKREGIKNYRGKYLRNETRRCVTWCSLRSLSLRFFYPAITQLSGNNFSFSSPSVRASEIRRNENRYQSKRSSRLACRVNIISSWHAMKL